jgi:hypothetical protein
MQDALPTSLPPSQNNISLDSPETQLGGGPTTSLGPDAPQTSTQNEPGAHSNASLAEKGAQIPIAEASEGLMSEAAQRAYKALSAASSVAKEAKLDIIEMRSPERLRESEPGDCEMRPVDENAGELDEKGPRVKDCRSMSEAKVEPSAAEEAIARSNMAVSNFVNDDVLMEADTPLAEQ